MLSSQECSVNSPDYGPLPPNSPGWCLAPFDPEGILRLYDFIFLFSLSFLLLLFTSVMLLFIHRRKHLDVVYIYMVINNFLCSNYLSMECTKDVIGSLIIIPIDRFWYQVAHLFCFTNFQFINGSYYMFCGVAVWAHTYTF